MDKEIFSSPEYVRSRVAYIGQCTFEYFITLLVADAFLAKLLTHLGISDSLIGIISSLVSLAFVVQIFSVFLCQTKINSKKIVIAFDVTSHLLFTSLYLIPFMPLPSNAVKIVVMVGILGAYSCMYLILNICFRWANSYVSPDHRGSYSAKKEIVSLISGIIFTTCVGFVFDRYETKGNIEGGFLFIAVLMAIIAMLNLASLILIKRETPSTDNPAMPIERKSLSDVFKNTLGNKKFRPVIILTVLWNMAQYFTIGFLGTFKTNDLLISVFLIQIINMVGNIARIFVSMPFGKFSDKTSFAKGMHLALAIAACSFLCNVFTTKTTWFLIIFYTVLYSISMAGINQNSFNITYSYVDSKYITEAMAIKNCIGGLFGFGSSIIASRILQAIQDNGNSFLGIKIYGQQLLSLISVVLCIICVLLLWLVIEKNECKKNN